MRKTKKWFKTKVRGGQGMTRFHMGSHEYAQKTFMMGLFVHELITTLSIKPYMKVSEDGCKYYATLTSLIKALRVMPGNPCKDLVKDLKYLRHNGFGWQPDANDFDFNTLDVKLNEEIVVCRRLPNLRKHKGRAYNVVKRVS